VPEGLPVVAIVGRPNVGKSTLFNVWTGRRRAIVTRTPGTTRDRISAVARAWRPSGEEVGFELVDTGGVGIVDEAAIEKEVTAQIEAAVARSDVLVFLLDTRAGALPLDTEAAGLLRRAEKPVIVAANKCETEVLEAEAANFEALGLGPAIPMSAEARTGLDVLKEAVAGLLPEAAPAGPAEEAGRDAAAPSRDAESPPRIAIVGRRNAGKSTFVNALAGSARVVVSDVPGTTRDPVDVAIELDGERVVLVDTAGVGRRREGTSAPDHFSLSASRRSIERAEAVLLLVDCLGKVGKVERDLADVANECYRPAVIVVNKWDLVEAIAEEQNDEEDGGGDDGDNDGDDGGVNNEEHDKGHDEGHDMGEATAPVGEASSEPGAAAARFEGYLERRLSGLAHAPIVFASALEGERVAEAAKLAAELARKARIKHPTSKLNKMVQRALRERKPPSPRGEFPRVYYATQTGISPPTVALFVNDPRRFPPTYVKFLANRFREYWDEGVGEVPVRVVLKARPRR
jgi:GTP-binding protein